jgi:putative addiction module component (TIGR02574 family)
MSTKAQQILEDSFALPPLERAAIAAGLLSSLDRPDPQIDALWAVEVEARLTAYNAGHMKAILAEDVFAELDQL